MYIINHVCWLHKWWFRELHNLHHKRSIDRLIDEILFQLHPMPKLSCRNKRAIRFNFSKSLICMYVRAGIHFFINFTWCRRYYGMVALAHTQHVVHSFMFRGNSTSIDLKELECCVQISKCRKVAYNILQHQFKIQQISQCFF